MKTAKSVDKNTQKRMKQFYETSKTYSGFLKAHDETYLRSYVELVNNYAKPNSFILELGCGNGLSSRMLKDSGHRVIGTDLSTAFLEDTDKWKNKRLRYLACDALSLPFNENTFDIVCSNELIEHVTNAEKVLDEMTRVVKLDGRIIIAGPSLCSPFVPLLDFFRILRGKKKQAIWAETELQAISGVLKNLWLCIRKRFSKKPDFLYREPDLEDRVIGGDADSVYYANPIDLEKFFKSKELKIIRLAEGYGIKGKLMAKLFPRFGLYISMVVEK